MKLLNKVLTASAALSLVAMPVVAHAADASKLSLSPSVRAGASVEKSEKVAGGGIIVAVLAAAAVIAGIVIIADSDDESDSN